MEKLTTLRGIIREFRYALPERSLKDNLIFNYLMKQYRKYKTTDQQLCKAQEEMNFIANSYLCYLRSSRLSQEIHDEFHGKGERTVQETADMIGFKLPHDPK
ncbi:protein FMC1 homolog [Euwallacea similis]|uniref:protein FMC1 homolog n=1 Tax=Euwallacea similis TaxID=1736056 RepID=UPI00344C1815